MNNYKKIADYIKYLKVIYNLEVTIKDYCGFVSNHKQLDRELRPYLAHCNPYCMFIKEEKTRYERCLAQNKKLVKQCKKGEGFVGYCPFGVCEYVIPIMKDDFVFGSVNISNFNIDEEIRVQKLNYSFLDKKEREKAESLYSKFMKTSIVDYISMDFHFQLVAAFLSEIASQFVKKDETSLNTKAEVVQKYIEEHIEEKISRDSLIKELNLKQEELSKIIKKSGKTNFNDMVNLAKIEKSETLLNHTDLSPKEISEKLGFKDYQYFSKLFFHYILISPKDYRKYYQNEKLIQKLDKN